MLRSNRIQTLFAFGILVLNAGAQQSPKGASIDDTKGAPSAFAGRWVNQDTHARGITRIQLQPGEGQIGVHVWGKCHPSDCDWGEAAADAVDGKLSVRWDHGFAVRDQQVALRSDGRLQVTTHTHFIDQSRREDYTTLEYFVRE
jgi:hypothetical protein